MSEDILRLGKGRGSVAGGRALRVKPVGLIAVGIPAANSLSRIFVRIGYRLNGLPYTIPDSMPGSLDCAAGDCNPLLFRRHQLREAVTPQAVLPAPEFQSVMRRMLASKISVEEVR